MATEIGQLERNKDLFLEYIKYFENIARNSKHIKTFDIALMPKFKNSIADVMALD